jgi:hypothetical protein
VAAVLVTVVMHYQTQVVGAEDLDTVTILLLELADLG